MPPPLRVRVGDVDKKIDWLVGDKNDTFDSDEVTYTNNATNATIKRQ